nr:MAG: hypothetical protein DIU78_19820 [Pseudomonadota bacterium]
MAFRQRRPSTRFSTFVLWERCPVAFRQFRGRKRRFRAPCVSPLEDGRARPERDDRGWHPRC